MAYTVRFHPDDDKQNMLMAGTADKKILQMDTDTGDVVQVRPGCLLAQAVCVWLT